MKKILIIFTCFLAVQQSQAQPPAIRSVKITDIESIMRELKTPAIINMWATWCKPCVEEIPYFLKEVEENNKGLRADTGFIQLILVSLDFKDAYPESVSRFAEKRNYKATLLWLDETNADYFCPKIDPAWSGAIPASLFLNPRTGYRRFFEKQLSHKDLQQAIRDMLR